MKKAAFALVLGLLALCATAQDSGRLYASVSASTVYLRHEVYLDPSLCKNAQLVKRWETERRTRLLSAWYAISSGSGFLVDDGGLLLTNRHVAAMDDLEDARSRAANSLAYTVERDASSAFSTEDRRLIKLDLYAMLTKGAYRFSATMGGKTVTEVSRVAMAAKDEPDIAVLKLPGGLGPGLTLAAPEALKPEIVGKEVYSFGFPLEPVFNELVVTMNKGTVSAIRKTDLGIQHSASISYGNSGGPLVDSSGLVLGMNSAMIKDGNNLFFAVGADKIREFLGKRGIQPGTRSAEASPLGPAEAPAGGDEKVAVMAALRESAEGENAAVAVGVEALPVSSQVSVTGERGSEVFLDGQRIGFAPMVLLMTKPAVSISIRGPGGAYMARLRLDPALQGVTALNAELQGPGDLSIACDDASARVYLDGIELGQAGAGPFRSLPAGNHRLELVGSNTYCSQEVSVAPAAATSVKAELRPVGRLDIRVPADFRTSIKSSTYSATIAGSANLSNIPAGDYSIQATSADSPLFTTSFSLRKGVQASWAPCSLGYLALEASPAGALCVLGPGRSFMAGGASEAMAPGTYTALLSHAGYRDQEIGFSVFAGKRTRVSARLTELGRGAISIPRLGSPVDIVYQHTRKSGREGKDGEVYFADIPSGVQLSISFVSVAGQTTGIPERQLTLNEGETRKLELPSGRFSLPWLPEGAVVEVGSERKVELRSEGSEGFLSPLLAAGDYLVGVHGGPKGTDCWVKGTILPEATTELESYRGEMLGYLGYEKSVEEKSLAHRSARTRWGVASLVTGIVGTAATTTFYFLGKGAKADYDAAETSSDAEDRWGKVGLYQTLFYASAAVGVGGLGGSYLLFRGGPDPKVLRNSIDALDKGIEALGKSGQ